MPKRITHEGRALPDQRLSLAEASAALNVPTTTVRLWLARGDLAGGTLTPDPAARRLTPPPLWVSAAAVQHRLAARKARADVRLAVTVGALKGGVGKSTTAWVLATLLSHDGGRVLLVDADPNSQTLDTWARRADAAGRPAPFTVYPWSTGDLRAGIRPPVAGYDHLIIDTGPDGRDPLLFQAACGLAPVLLMPFAPRDVELGRLPATLQVAQDGSVLSRRPVWPVVLLNRVTSRGGQSAQTRADLAAGPPALRDVPVLDCEVRDLAVFTTFAAPLTREQCGDFVGVLDELREFTTQTDEETA